LCEEFFGNVCDYLKRFKAEIGKYTPPWDNELSFDAEKLELFSYDFTRLAGIIDDEFIYLRDQSKSHLESIHDTIKSMQSDQHGLYGHKLYEDLPMGFKDWVIYTLII
jgi:hypothetical protein